MAYADLLSAIFVPALSGRNVLQGRSKLAGRLGETVTAPLLSLYDDPHRKGADGSTWFDAEGTPTNRLDFVRDGVLTAFAYDLKTAYRAGKASHRECHPGRVCRASRDRPSQFCRGRQTRRTL